MILNFQHFVADKSSQQEQKKAMLLKSITPDKT